MGHTQTTNADLQAKREALQAQIDSLAATRSKDTARRAAELVKAGRALLADDDAALAGLRQQIDEIDEKFHVQRQADAERLAAARAAELEQRRTRFMGSIETVLDAIAEQEAAALALFAARGKMLDALAAAREDAKVLSPNGKTRGFDAVEVQKRIGDRLATLAVKQMAGGHRYGGCQFGVYGGHGDHPYGWREQEERRLASAVQAILGEG